MARELLLNINEIGLPCAVEFLDTITPQFIGDLVSWGAIGARTTESQVHRELASGLSAPVGFKNGTDGNVQIAIDALKAAREPHHFLSVTKQGLSAIICTTGNDSCHVILRGGNAGPNYKAEFVVPILEKLKAAGVNERIMIDCSHGNSEKDHRKQRLVAEDIITQLPEEHGIKIAGVMIESNLVEGKQNVSDAHTEKGLVYGQSVTDACINWEDTVVILNTLRDGVRSRRLASSKQ
jgi:3-deoxy-7-phosphoheptulonate synthase